MTKELFVNKMNEVKKLLECESEIDAAMYKLDNDFGGFSMSGAITLIVELLQISMSDNNGLISYYIFEADWGNDFDAIYKDDIEIPLKTIEDLYNILKGQ